MFKKGKLGIAVTSVLLVAGCGGGGGSSSGSEASPVESVTVSGRAADGYLSNASVCLDTNDNGTCDAGEPNATTGSGGVFELDATVSEAASKLVVEAIANLTVDEDTGLPVPKGFTLRAPVNLDEETQFVSPITTLVADEMDRNSSTLAQAKQAVSQSLNTSFDVMADFIAAGEGDANGTVKQNAERLHRIAQVTARISAEVESQVNQSDLDQLQITRKELLTLISTQIKALMPILLADIEESLDNPEFDPDQFLDSPEYDVAPPSVESPDTGSTPGNDAELADRLLTAIPSSPFFAITPSGDQGIQSSRTNVFDFAANPQVNGTFYLRALQRSLEATEGEFGRLAFGETASRNTGDGLVMDVVPPDTADVKIWANGQHQLEVIAGGYLAEQNVTSDGATYYGSSYNGAINTTSTLMQISLEGLSVKGAIPDLFDSIPDSALETVQGDSEFQSGALAYARSETFDEAVYMTDWRDDDGDNGYCGGTAYIDEVKSCNVVYGEYTLNQDAMPTRTFDELMYPSGTGADDEVTILGGKIIFSSGSSEYHMMLRGQAANGSGSILVQRGFEGPVLTGTWVMESEPFQHVRLNLPDGIYYNAALDEIGGAGYAFLHEHEGYVRAGRFSPAGKEVAEFFGGDVEALELNSQAATTVANAMFQWGLLSAHPAWSDQ
jgi:hypothetical protein